MTDSSSKSGSFARLRPPSPRDDDRVPAARWQNGRRRLAGLLRPSVETNVVALLCSGLATAVTILLAVSVYRLHDRVRVLELRCISPAPGTDDASSAAVDQVYHPVSQPISCNVVSRKKTQKNGEK